MQGAEGCGTECGMVFKTIEEQHSHNQKVHASGLVTNIKIDTKPDRKVDIVCELCDKLFPNRIQKSNHKLLVHTVREDQIQCDYCGEAYTGLKEICKHISSKHSELFPDKPNNENECNMCYEKLNCT